MKNEHAVPTLNWIPAAVAEPALEPVQLRIRIGPIRHEDLQGV